MSSPVLQPLYRYNKQVFEILCIGIAGSLIFWPLASSLLSIALIAWWLVFTPIKTPASTRDKFLVLLFSSLYLLVLIGSLYSTNTAEAVFKIQQKSALLVFPVVFGCSRVLTDSSLRKIGSAFSLFVFLGCIVCLANGVYFYGQTGSAEKLTGYGLVILKDMSPFILAMCCVLSVIFLAQRFYERNFTSRKEQVAAIVLIVFFSLFLLLLGNRNTLLTWLIVAVFYFLRIVNSRRWSIAFIGLLIVTLLGAIFTNPALKRQWKDLADISAGNSVTLDEDSSLGRDWGGKAIRLAIWKCSGDIIRDHWLTGVGTGDAQQALQDAYEKRKFYFASRYNKYNAHNQYIQETIAGGIAGLVVLLACFLVPFVLYARANYPPYLLFLSCIIIICLTESIFELSKGVILYSFFNSIFAFTKRNTAS